MQPDQALGEAVVTKLIRECQCKRHSSIEESEEALPPLPLPLPTLERIAVNLPSRPPCRERIRQSAMEPLRQLAHEFHIIAGVIDGPDPEEAIEMFLSSLKSALLLARQMDRELAVECNVARLGDDFEHCPPRIGAPS